MNRYAYNSYWSAMDRIIRGFPVSIGTIFVTVRHPTYRKSVVRPIRPTLMLMTRTSAAPMSYHLRLTRFSAPSTFHSLVLLTRRAGMAHAQSSSISFVIVVMFDLWLKCRFELRFPFSLLTDMNRLLIQSNGTVEGYTPSVAHPSTSAVNGSSSVETPAGPSVSNNDVRRLQDEVNQLTKRNGGTTSIHFSSINYPNDSYNSIVCFSMPSSPFLSSNSAFRRWLQSWCSS